MILLISRCNDLVTVRKAFHHLLNFLIVLKILDGKVACRVCILDCRGFPDQMFETVYTMLKLSSVIDVDMSREVRITLFIDLDDSIKQFINSFAHAAHSRNHRHTQ